MEYDGLSADGSRRSGADLPRPPETQNNGRLLDSRMAWPVDPLVLHQAIVARGTSKDHTMRGTHKLIRM